MKRITIFQRVKYVCMYASSRHIRVMIIQKKDSVEDRPEKDK